MACIQQQEQPLVEEQLSVGNATKQSNRQPEQQQRPAVGVLCIDVAQEICSSYGEHVRSYIPASYVKFLEMAGADPVPIWIGRERSYYDDIMSYLNGVLFPGGAIFIDPPPNDSHLPNDCVFSSAIIYEIALRKNAAGEHFPLWGTCLGMQLLLHHAAPEGEVRQHCKPLKCMLPVVKASGFAESRLFAGLSAELLACLQEPVAFHSHTYCITNETLLKHKLNEQWRVVTTEKDGNDLEFISAIEHKRYPFYGVQFHPERACFEHVDAAMVRLAPCITLAQYMANFFVAECRKSGNRFASDDERLRHLISNFEVTPTGRKHLHWLQCYLFDSKPQYPIK